jgi:hypothetical protein
MTACRFENDGQPPDDAGRYRHVCVACGVVRRSKYAEPRRIHRRCGAAHGPPRPPECDALGPLVDEIAYTSPCGQPARARVYECEQHGRCLRRAVRGTEHGLIDCRGCEDREPRESRRTAST